MSQSAIRKILETRLATWAAARVPPLPVLWQNVNVATEPAGDHLRAFLLPAATTSQFLAGDDRNLRGIFQVSIFCPAGAGSKKAEAIAADLDVLFPCAERFTDGAFAVQVLTPVSIAPAMQEQETGWLHVPVSFRYGAHVTTTN